MYCLDDPESLRFTSDVNSNIRFEARLCNSTVRSCAPASDLERIGTKDFHFYWYYPTKTYLPQEYKEDMLAQTVKHKDILISPSTSY